VSRVGTAPRGSVGSSRAGLQSGSLAVDDLHVSLCDGLHSSGGDDENEQPAFGAVSTSRPMTARAKQGGANSKSSGYGQSTAVLTGSGSKRAGRTAMGRT
jgi:hypothetical protein